MVGGVESLATLDTVIAEWIQALTLLAPGKGVEFSEEFFPNPEGRGGPVFEYTRLRPGEAIDRGMVVTEHVTFDPKGPGTYRMRFTYQYSGPDAGKKGVYRGQLLSNVLTFEVR